jgi:hypothetical protein
MFGTTLRRSVQLAIVVTAAVSSPGHAAVDGPIRVVEIDLSMLRLMEWSLKLGSITPPINRACQNSLPLGDSNLSAETELWWCTPIWMTSGCGWVIM